MINDWFCARNLFFLKKDSLHLSEIYLVGFLKRPEYLPQDEGIIKKGFVPTSVATLERGFRLSKNRSFFNNDMRRSA